MSNGQDQHHALVTEDTAALFRAVMKRVDEITAEYSFHELVPNPVDQHFPVMIDRMINKTTGCGERVAMQAVLIACDILRCKRPDGDAMAGYCAILGEVPQDLLLPSVRHALGKEEYHVLPTPGSLIAHARPAMQKRRDAISKIKVAKNRLDLAALKLKRRRTAISDQSDRTSQPTQRPLPVPRVRSFS